MTGEVIRTPDQRLRVFVSSTLAELAEERRAVRAAVEQLRLSPVMFELGARPHPPRALYRAYLKQSDVFVGVYWQSYGWIAPDMEISGLEDELALSAGMPRLIYVKRPAADMEPRLKEMLARLREEESTSYKPFTGVDELQRLVLDDLSLLLTEHFTSSRRPAAEPAAPAPLPVPTTTFVGRESELAALTDLLARGQSRLVTLVGPGGTGKTRLALEAAARVQDRFPQGVVLVDLSSERDPQKVLAAVVRAVGPDAGADAPPLEALARGLREARLLLLLDNCEQVTGAAPDLAQLVGSCPGLTLLVTSRESLRVRGEAVVAVPPLELPDEGPVTVDAARTAAAVRLFLDRAADVVPAFGLDAANVADVVAVCRQLDGLPLAIELAAARLRLFAVDELRDRLARGLDELRGGARDLPERQQALRRTIEWSVGLLDRDEQLVLAALSLFSGARLTDVEAVLGRVPELARLDIVGCVASLLDKSLLHSQTAAAGRPRTAMLQTIRAYAGELLADRPDLAAALRHAHAAHYADLAQHWQAAADLDQRSEALAALADEHANLRTAWAYWVDKGDVPALNDLLEVLWGYYDAHGAYREAVALGEDLLVVLSLQPSSAERVRDEIAMQASLARSMIAVHGYTAEVERRIREALGRAGEPGAGPHRFPVLRALATLHLLRADVPRSREMSEELLDIAQELHDPALLADAHQLAGITQASVDVERGLRHLDTSIELFDAGQPPRIQFRIGPNPGVVAHVISGLLLWMTGFPERAQRRVDRGLELAAGLGHPYTEAYTLFHASLLALWRNDHERLASLADDLRRVAEAHDYPIWRALALVLAGSARIAAGRPDEGLADVDRGFALYADLETPPVFWTALLTIRAAGCVLAGRFADAGRYLDEARSAEWEGDPVAAHVETLRGDLQLAGPHPDTVAAAAAYERAVALAERQGSRMAQLQALSRLAVLHRGTPREPAAHAALRQVLDSFTEGFQEPPLVDARRLLDERQEALGGCGDVGCARRDSNP